MLIHHGPFFLICSNVVAHEYERLLAIVAAWNEMEDN